MSSILKALKKLEDEQSPATARQEHIARYEERPVATGRMNRSLLVLGCGIVIGVLCAGGWMMLRGESSSSDKQTAMIAPPEPPADTEKVVISPPPAIAPAASAEQGSSPAQGQVLLRQPDSATSAVAGKRPSSPVPVETAGKAPGETPAHAAAGTSAAAAAVRPIPAVPNPVSPVSVKEVRVPTSDVAAVTGGAGPATPPLAIVTEIYFEPDGGSMAVVDDLPVMEGTTVNGALVDKIMADRVRFLVNGKAVEVPLQGGP